uniref:Acyl--binding domain-containing protein 4-like n=1 Tax=Tetraselmis sp. GSL018 TaxID=582737 RepID=A0A061QV50_9CHLO|eukprot:CAMPEP_0177607246 /NCGR_PEP_ID=MMETSP0419_2-20121207/17807_1 /TAXON_ID=582737 /ORGANISM="Tetraselmis sp., Strain GSL018" /LENGTH=395 /DNA_ID=CAMNT_0019101799 /DNA_START=148 /DNA_END=1335 /DNA_ORIENTATION=-
MSTDDHLKTDDRENRSSEDNTVASDVSSNPSAGTVERGCSGSGAVLASQLPYPEKFFVAARLSGAPEHAQFDLDDSVRLLLYALYRQATDGPCKDPRPSVFDPIGTAKYAAYSRLGNTNALEAMFLYVRTLEEEKPKLWDELSARVGTKDPGDQFGEMEKGKEDSPRESRPNFPEESEQEEPCAEADGSTQPPNESGKSSDTEQIAEAIPQKARLPGVPREPGAVDSVLHDTMRLSRLPSKEAARTRMQSLKPDMKAVVQRMMFVEELLSNQADLERKKREAAALGKAMDVPGGPDREIGIKVASLVECGKFVVGVIEREVADWTDIAAEELAAGPEDMICDRGTFAFRHLPRLARLRAEWVQHLAHWEKMKAAIPPHAEPGFSIYNMLFQSITA